MGIVKQADRRCHFRSGARSGKDHVIDKIGTFTRIMTFKLTVAAFLRSEDL
jgi:hypothetical protein